MDTNQGQGTRRVTENISIPASTEAKHENQSEDTEKNSTEPHQKHGHPQTLRQRWKATGLPNKLSIIFSALIFLATAVYAAFSGWQLAVMKKQLNEIHSGSKDTHDVAVAAGKQADAAKTQSEQAIQQTATMGQSLSKTDDLIRATVDLAKQAKRSADIASLALKANEESTEQERRPWVGIMAVQCSNCVSKQDRSLSIGQLFATVANTGKTPALDLTINAFSTTRKREDQIPDMETEFRKSNDMTAKGLQAPTWLPPDERARMQKEMDVEAQYILPPKQVLPPNGAIVINLISSVLYGPQDILKLGRMDERIVYAFVEIKYSETGRKIQHTTHVCLMNDFGNNFRFCPSGNNMN